MQIRATIRQVGNTFSPDLQRRVRRLSGSGRTELLERIGMTLVSISKRSFSTDSTFRPFPWQAKANGQAATLQKSTMLRRSISSRVHGSGVTISSDRPYAAIHQLGGKTRPHIIRARRKKALHWGGNKFAKSVKHPGSRIPARPFLPFYRDGSLTTRASRNVESLMRQAVEGR